MLSHGAISPGPQRILFKNFLKQDLILYVWVFCLHVSMYITYIHVCVLRGWEHGVGGCSTFPRTGVTDSYKSHLSAGIRTNVLWWAASTFTCLFTSPASCPLHRNLNSSPPRNGKQKQKQNKTLLKFLWCYGLNVNVPLGSCLGRLWPVLGAGTDSHEGRSGKHC